MKNPEEYRFRFAVEILQVNQPAQRRTQHVACTKIICPERGRLGCFHQNKNENNLRPSKPQPEIFLH